ncbi:MAG: hypothetical protein ACWGQW_01235 [bacterium]
MAKIIDPDDISYVVDTTAGGSDEMEVQTGAKTIELLPQGTLSDASPGATSGITGKCFYSKLKEIWNDDDNLNKHKFPIQMIYEASFQWINGWGPANQQTRDLIRDAGFAETDGRENACIITLGSMNDVGDQAYYTQVAGFDQTTSTFDKSGEVDENISTKGTGGSPDYSGYLKCFLREEQKTFASYNLLDEQGLSALKYEAYRLPLANALDNNAVDNDTQIGTTDAGSISGVKYSELTIDYLVGALFASVSDTTYALDDVVQEDNGSGSHWFRCTGAGTVTGSTGVAQSSWGGTSTWEAYPGERLIGTEYYAYNRILDVQDTTNSFYARLKEIHSWAQYQLRQSSNINDDVEGDGYGTVYGNVALAFTSFVGDTLNTAPGVFIDNYDPNDKNSITFYDITVDGGGLNSEDAPYTSTGRTFPYTAAGYLNFSQNFVDEADATTRYSMYFLYITDTSTTDLAVTGVSGDNGTLDWSGDAGALDHLANNDYVYISGFVTETTNNGLWKITGSPSSNTVSATKMDGVAPVTEATGEAANVKENPFESPGAIIVDDESDTDISGQVTSASIAFTFKYTTNAQGGRTPDTDAPIVVVAIADDGAQWTLASYTITKSTGQAIPINAVDELNYLNPA